MNEFRLDGATPVISNLNARKETHGEELGLACDLRVKLTRKSSPLAYDQVSALVLRSSPATGETAGANEADEETAETINYLLTVADAISFGTELENMRVSIRQSTRKLAIFGHAKISKFRLIEKDEALAFRISGAMDHQSIGRLAGAIQEMVNLDIDPAQTELDLPDSGAPEDDGE